MSNSKPREFWVSNKNPLDICKDAHVYDNKAMWFDGTEIHVIEKSAADKLADALESAIKMITGEYCSHTIKCGDHDSCYAQPYYKVLNEYRGKS